MSSFPADRAREKVIHIGGHTSRPAVIVIAMCLIGFMSASLVWGNPPAAVQMSATQTAR